MLDVVVLGAGPAGVVAALRAADLGAKTALITRDEFGGMMMDGRKISDIKVLERLKLWKSIYKTS